MERRRIVVTGLVQGVGFRPFVYVLARELGLSGEVSNTPDGVVTEVEGPAPQLDAFARRLADDAPALARVESVTESRVPLRGGTEFTIIESQGGTGRTLVSADVATCDACLAELRDPADRRYRHPFISCTNCGPRFTVVVDLPYDRPSTTMADLPLCERCAKEYADPADRRFHAQTVACPDCGPTLYLTTTADAQPRKPRSVDAQGFVTVTGADAMTEARHLLRAGRIVAVKGIGGYHLACDATNEAAVARLRGAKRRGDKPFAVMVPDVETAASFAAVDDAEADLLTGPQRPVVLLVKRSHPALPLAASVAPDHPDVGVMVAYTPVHHLLFGLAGDEPAPPVLVMTSANRSGEPIVTGDEEARAKLADLADAWLWHDRPIHVPCDDSVVRMTGGRVLPVRRSRGYAPLPVAVPVPVRPALAIGGDLKNAFCLGDGGYAWMSAHVGDLDDFATQRALDRAVSHLEALTGVKPELIVADAHPGYRSVAWAHRNSGGLPVREVQHHHAHIASAMADNGYDGASPVIGFAFDGTGYGTDGAIWGGEVLIADYAQASRAAHLRYVPLPGGDAAVRNPWRMALSQLRSSGVPWSPTLPPVGAGAEAERSVLARQLATGLACVPTSSMGRLFDAVSSLAGVCHRIDYEAEAAMRFEELARPVLGGCGPPYRFGIEPEGDSLVLDQRPVIAAVASDVAAGMAPAVVAARFHLAVADMVLETAVRLRARTGITTAALSGGVFLNAVLTGSCVVRLSDAGFRVLAHRNVPPSDAGLALGQLMIGARA